MLKIGKMMSEVASKYNNQGYRLLDVVSEGAVTKVAYAETDFGRGLIHLSSNYDKGKLVKRTIKDCNYYPTRPDIERTYRREGGILFTTTKKLLNGAEIETIEEATFVRQMPNGKKAMTRMQLHIYPDSDGMRKEVQVFEDLFPAGVQPPDAKKLTTSAIRLPDGSIINQTIEGKNINLEDVADDPYLFIRNYGPKEFAESAYHIAKEKQRVSGLKGKLVDERIGDGISGEYDNITGNIIIDSSVGGKPDIVYVLNHENRHKWQDNFIGKYFKQIFNVFRKVCNRIVLTSEQNQMAKRLIKAQFWERLLGNYMPEKMERSLFTELDATKAGELAQKEYEKYSAKLAQIFDVPLTMTHGRSKLV